MIRRVAPFPLAMFSCVREEHDSDLKYRTNKQNEFLTDYTTCRPTQAQHLMYMHVIAGMRAAAACSAARNPSPHIPTPCIAEASAGAARAALCSSCFTASSSERSLNVSR